MANESTDTTCNDETTIPLPLHPDPNYIYPSSTLTESLKRKIGKTHLHPAIVVPVRRTTELRRTLKDVLMHRPKMRDVHPVVDERDFVEGVDPAMERKLVLKLYGDEDNGGNDNNNFAVYRNSILEEFLRRESDAKSSVRKSTHEVHLGYDYYSTEQILSLLLPKPSSNNTEIPSSFEVVGHLAHLNLRSEYLPYKFIIGKVILEKIKCIKIVVNKIGTITNEYRTFPMEVLAIDSTHEKRETCRYKEGDLCEELEVEVKEDGCTFRLDFAKVYWNSRLQFEHKRLVTLIAGKDRTKILTRKTPKSKKRQKQRRNELEDDENAPHKEIIVADACAGIGPFAVPLTSRHRSVVVHANDLNPTSYRYLRSNGKLNDCSPSGLKTYNMDGREFIRMLDDGGVRYDHVLMNLPAIAPEFLNVFRGWKRNCNDGDGDDGGGGGGGGGGDGDRPMVHVHCFGGKDETANDEAIDRCARAMGCKLDKEVDKVMVHVVRNVSPKKNMLCVSFRLPKGVEDVKRVEKFEKFHSNATDGDGGNGDEDEGEKSTMECVSNIGQETDKKDDKEKDSIAPSNKRPRIL